MDSINTDTINTDTINTDTINTDNDNQLNEKIKMKINLENTQKPNLTNHLNEDNSTLVFLLLFTLIFLIIILVIFIKEDYINLKIFSSPSNFFRFIPYNTKKIIIVSCLLIFYIGILIYMNIKKPIDVNQIKNYLNISNSTEKKIDNLNNSVSNLIEHHNNTRTILYVNYVFLIFVNIIFLRLLYKMGSVTKENAMIMATHGYSKLLNKKMDSLSKSSNNQKGGSIDLTLQQLDDLIYLMSDKKYVNKSLKDFVELYHNKYDDKDEFDNSSNVISNSKLLSANNCEDNKVKYTINYDSDIFPSSFIKNLNKIYKDKKDENKFTTNSLKKKNKSNK